MNTKIFACDICNFDKFHICIEDNNIFITCANCGIRTNINIKDSEYLKINE